MLFNLYLPNFFHKKKKKNFLIKGNIFFSLCINSLFTSYIVSLSAFISLFISLSLFLYALNNFFPNIPLFLLFLFSSCHFSSRLITSQPIIHHQNSYSVSPSSPTFCCSSGFTELYPSLFSSSLFSPLPSFSFFSLLRPCPLGLLASAACKNNVLLPT